MSVETVLVRGMGSLRYLKPINESDITDLLTLYYGIVGTTSPMTEPHWNGVYVGDTRLLRRTMAEHVLIRTKDYYKHEEVQTGSRLLNKIDKKHQILLIRGAQAVVCDSRLRLKHTALQILETQGAIDRAKEIRNERAASRRTISDHGAIAGEVILTDAMSSTNGGLFVGLQVHGHGQPDGKSIVVLLGKKRPYLDGEIIDFLQSVSIDLPYTLHTCEEENGRSWPVVAVLAEGGKCDSPKICLTVAVRDIAGIHEGSVHNPILAFVRFTGGPQSDLNRSIEYINSMTTHYEQSTRDISVLRADEEDSKEVRIMRMTKLALEQDTPVPNLIETPFDRDIPSNDHEESSIMNMNIDIFDSEGNGDNRMEESSLSGRTFESGSSFGLETNSTLNRVRENLEERFRNVSDSDDEMGRVD